MVIDAKENETRLGRIGLLIRWVLKIDTFKLNPYQIDRLEGFSIFGHITIRTTIMFSMGILSVPLLIGITRTLGQKEIATAYAAIAIFVLPDYVVYRKATKERKRILKQLGIRLNSISDRFPHEKHEESESMQYEYLHTLY